MNSQSTSNSEAALTYLSPTIATLAEMWAASPLRPRPRAEIVHGWNGLLEEWIASDLPLPCRAALPRGAHNLHRSGRVLTFSDNTAAHWAFSLAIAGIVPSLKAIEELFKTASMPLAFAIKKAEREHLRYTRGGLSSALRLNADGWKICHIDRVGRNAPTHPCEAPIEEIEKHFKRFLSPGNMFLVPLKLAGFGELPEVVSAVAKSDTHSHGAAPQGL